MPACFEISYTAPTAETPLTRTMKETFFYFSLKRAALMGLAAATVLGSSVVLTACGGGGGDGGPGGKGFKITNAQFASGQRGFSIQSNSGWEFWSDGSDSATGDFTMPDADTNAGVLLTWGKMLYSFTGVRDQLYGLMRYNYDPTTNTATLRYSMDTTNLGNMSGNDTAEAVTGMINTIHGNGSFADAVGPDGEAVTPGNGDGGTNNPGDLSTHLSHTVIIFDFNTGTCKWTCGCGHESATMDFLVRDK